MSCICGQKNFMNKTPISPCVFCAHKHITAAKALYEMEIGYKDINKSDAIGQMILAAWHYDKSNHDLAIKCRDIWLKMEKLMECKSDLENLQATAWKLVVDNNLNGE